MTKFRSRPISPTEIEAIQWTGKNLDALFTLTGRIKRDGLVDGEIGIFSPIEHKAGYRSARIGDWIVKTADGDVRPMKPEVFAATYELIKE